MSSCVISQEPWTSSWWGKQRWGTMKTTLLPCVANPEGQQEMLPTSPAAVAGAQAGERGGSLQLGPQCGPQCSCLPCYSLLSSANLHTEPGALVPCRTQGPPGLQPSPLEAGSCWIRCVLSLCWPQVLSTSPPPPMLPVLGACSTRVAMVRLPTEPSTRRAAPHDSPGFSVAPRWG